MSSSTSLEETSPEELPPEELTLEETPLEETPLDQESSSVTVYLLIMCALIALHCWIRLPAVYLDYFHNEDTAGITYSADLLAQGGAPLIDTVEMKAPGSFFLLAGWWGLAGRSLMSAQLLGALWSGLAALGVMLGAWVLYRSRRVSCIAGLLYIYLAPFTDSIDINYGAWMITPYIWASVALFMTSGLSIASRDVFKLNRSLNSAKHTVSARVNPTLFKWMIVGALIALAALMKRQGAALFPLALLLAYRSAARWRASLSLICGTLLCFLCFFSLYIARGEGIEAMSGYFFSRSGWSYLANSLGSSAPQGVASVNSSLSSPLSAIVSTAKLERIGDGFAGLWEYLPLSLSLALLNLSSRLGLSSSSLREPSATLDMDQSRLGDQPREVTGVTITLIALTSLSFLGASLGLRFFKGYYLQLLPSLIWLAVDPRGLPWAWRRLWFELRRWSLSLRALRPISLIALLMLSALYMPSVAESSWAHLRRARAMRSRPLYAPARQIKQISHALKRRVSKRAERDEELTLWVWGRWAWPAYFYLRAPSPTRYFKNLGVLTTQLNNTWRRGGEPTRFNPKTPWREAISELKAHPPEVIIIALNESYRSFHALRSFLRSRYRELSYQELGLVSDQRSKRVGQSAGKDARRRARSRRQRRARQLFKVYELK